MNGRARGVLLPALVLALGVVIGPAHAQNPAGQDSAAVTDGTYELSGVEVQPELRNRSEAADLVQRFYPRELRRRGETAVLAMRFLILPDGTVDGTRISVASADNQGFSQAATRVVRQLRFTPAKVGGRPVAVWVTLPVVFMVPPGSAPPTRAP